MKVTLSIDDEIVSRARKIATRRGTSLTQMIRDYLEGVASDLSSDEILRELHKQWEKSSGDSRGQNWTREELHERAAFAGTDQLNT